MIRTLLTRLRDFWVEPLRARLAAVESAIADLQAFQRATHLAALAAAPRYADPRCLTRHGYKASSQNDEDGIIDEIFRRIGTTNRFFVEFGVETGVENNTLALLLAGWRGLWIEGDPAAQRALERNFESAIRDGLLRVRPSFVTAENIEGLLADAGVPPEPDLLSIDIDGNDYSVWRAIRRIRPRVVVIEYNASLGRSARAVMPYDPAARWDGTIGYGASLGALEDLGRDKGYALVGCNLVGVNAFFVRSDCVGDAFLPPFTAAQHYEPARYGRTGTGHPVRWMRFEQLPSPGAAAARAEDVRSTSSGESTGT